MIVDRPAVTSRTTITLMELLQCDKPGRQLIGRVQPADSEHPGSTHRMRESNRLVLGGYLTGASPATFCQRLVLGEVFLAPRVKIVPPSGGQLRVRPIAQASDADHLYVREMPQDGYQPRTD